MADELDSGSSVGYYVWVQVPSPACKRNDIGQTPRSFYVILAFWVYIGFLIFPYPKSNHYSRFMQPIGSIQKNFSPMPVIYKIHGHSRRIFSV